MILFESTGCQSRLSFSRLRKWALITLLLAFSASLKAEKNQSMLAIPHQAINVLSLGYGETKQSVNGRWLSAVYSEAFRRIGYSWRYHYRPFPRLSHESRRGMVHGELSRTDSYGLYHPNLLPVETPHLRDHILVVSVNPTLHIDDWQSLERGGYQIDFRAGSEHIRSRLQAIIDKDKMTAVPSTDSALSRLIRERTDILVISGFQLMPHLQQGYFEGHTIRINGILETINHHAYLHRHFRSLLPALNQALQSMARQGLLTQLRTEALTKVQAESTIAESKPTPANYVKNSGILRRSRWLSLDKSSSIPHL